MFAKHLVAANSSPSVLSKPVHSPGFCPQQGRRRAHSPHFHCLHRVSISSNSSGTGEIKVLILKSKLCLIQCKVRLQSMATRWCPVSGTRSLWLLVLLMPSFPWLSPFLKPQHLTKHLGLAGMTTKTMNSIMPIRPWLLPLLPLQGPHPPGRAQLWLGSCLPQGLIRQVVASFP